MINYPFTIGKQSYSKDELLEVGKNKYHANIYQCIAGISFILIGICNALFIIFFDQVIDIAHQVTYMFDVIFFVYYFLRWILAFWIINGVISLCFVVFGIVMFVRSFMKKKDNTYVQAGINYLCKQQRKMKKA